MGLFDTVRCTHGSFVCSEGHDLSSQDFQTKDLGQTMGNWSISHILEGKDGGWGEEITRPFLGRINVYGDCPRCPALVQAGTMNFCPTAVEFEVEIVDDIVRSVKRISEDTQKQLQTEKQQPWMEDCYGPMDYDEAYKLHCSPRKKRG